MNLRQQSGFEGPGRADAPGDGRDGDRPDARRVEARQEEARQEEAWLLGQSPLSAYLDFVEGTVVGGAEIPRAALVDEWRCANDYYHELETDEAGLADRIGILDCGPADRLLVEEVATHPRYRRAFDELPARFAFVELDRLVVPQTSVDLTHVERLKARIGRAPSREELFRICLPLERAEPPVQVRRWGSGKYLFWSPSADFRFQEAVLLAPDQIRGHEAFGPLGGVLGLMVGSGCNFMSGIESDGRVLLHNGHHRACALRDLGVTHAPCILRTVTRRDELNLVAPRQVVDSPAYYFKAARPPLLKDFFDPRIRRVFPVRRTVRMIEVSFEVRQVDVQDLSQDFSHDLSQDIPGEG